jgi:purine-nucleoside/S-methyl-5'-thioadenosine phosphorylase / adenosine deaminase
MSVASIPMPNTFIAEPQPTVRFAWTQASAGIGPALECDPLAAVARHLFTAHHLTLRGDPAEWQAVAAALGTDSSSIRLIKQVHRADVAVVRDRAAEWTPPEADIIVTDDPSLIIGVRVADCAPILIADPRRGAVGAVHAGWRGTVQRAAQAGVSAMTREFGSDPKDLIAAIGPCLGVCCGEVGEEVVEAFRNAGHDDEAVKGWFSIGPSGRFHLHLARANRDQLLGADLQADNVHVADLCTRSYPDVFHSYRAAGAKAGRMAAVIRVGN